MYRLKLVWMEFIRHKLSIFIQMVCLFFGMCVVGFFLSQANDAYLDIKENVDFLKIEKLTIFEHNIMAYQDIFDITIFDEIDNNLGDDITLKFSALEQAKQIMAKEQLITGVGVYSTNQTSEEIYQGQYMKDGVWTVHDGTCVIGENVAMVHNLKIGDSIYVNNTGYVIEGIFAVPRESNVIIVPYNSAHKILGNISIYLLNNSKDKMDNKLVKKEIKKLGDYTMITGEQYREGQLERLSSGWGVTIIICALIVVYSMFTIYNIFVFALKKNYKKIAVMQSCGASIRDIFIQKVIEISIIDFVATILSSLVIMNIENWALRLGMEIRFGWVVAIINYLLMFVVLLTILGISFRNLFKKSTIEIFQEARKS